MIRYSYLWMNDYARGREEGSKDRPCAVIVAKKTEGGEDIVTVVPITHSPPIDARCAIEIPAVTNVVSDSTMNDLGSC